MISLLFIINLLTSILPIVAHAAAVPTVFKDQTNIPTWAASSVHDAVQAGIVSGFPDGTFRPDGAVTRAQFMKMDAAALQLTVTGATYGADWYKPYVKALTDAGIHRTLDFDTNYNVAMTRLEMMRMAIRSVDPALLTAKDTTDEQLVLDCVQKGLINGVGSGELDLQGKTTRAQAVTVIERMLQVKAGKTLPMDVAAVASAKAAVQTGDPYLLDGKYASIGNFTVKDGKILFAEKQTPDAPKDYQLKPTVNPYINEQVYAAAKAVVGDKYYLLLRYDPVFGEIPADVAIQYYYSNQGSMPDDNSAFFKYAFMESSSYNVQLDWQNKPFSTDAVISLDVNSLNVGKDWPTTPYLVNKLKSSLIAIFGQSLGSEIADYVCGKFIGGVKMDMIPAQDEVKTFGNIEVDCVVEKNSTTPHFYFSYRK